MRNILTTLKQRAGFTLTELVVATAIMGTLAAVAVPKFSNVAEGAKAKKTIASIDMIIGAGVNFYNEMVVSEGRGRFPGQTTFKDAIDINSAENVWNETQWVSLFSDTIASPYQDGIYMFYIIAGSGTGDAAESPRLYVYDAENAGDFTRSVQP